MFIIIFNTDDNKLMVGGQRTTLYQKFGLSSTKTVGLPEFWYDFIFPKYFIVFKNYKL